MTRTRVILRLLWIVIITSFLLWSSWSLISYYCSQRYRIITVDDKVIITTKASLTQEAGVVVYRDPVTGNMERIRIDHVESVKKVRLRPSFREEVTIDEND